MAKGYDASASLGRLSRELSTGAMQRYRCDPVISMFRQERWFRRFNIYQLPCPNFNRRVNWVVEGCVMEQMILPILTAISGWLSSGSAIASFRNDYHRRTEDQVAAAFREDLKLLTDVQEFGAKIRNAANPYDATARRRDLMTFLDRICERYNDNIMPFGMRESAEQLLCTAVVMIERDWSREQGRQICDAGRNSFPNLQAFCNAHFDQIENIAAELSGTGSGPYKWRAPLSGTERDEHSALMSGRDAAENVALRRAS